VAHSFPADQLACRGLLPLHFPFKHFPELQLVSFWQVPPKACFTVIKGILGFTPVTLCMLFGAAAGGAPTTGMPPVAGFVPTAGEFACVEAAKKSPTKIGSVKYLENMFLPLV
jgi:hypothetical protein